jgi:hypothetical protein
MTMLTTELIKRLRERAVGEHHSRHAATAQCLEEAADALERTLAVLAGTDIGSLPAELDLPAIAAIRMAERAKASVR